MMSGISKEPMGFSKNFPLKGSWIWESNSSRFFQKYKLLLINYHPMPVTLHQASVFLSPGDHMGSVFSTTSSNF